MDKTLIKKTLPLFMYVFLSIYASWTSDYKNGKPMYRLFNRYLIATVLHHDFDLLTEH